MDKTEEKRKRDELKKIHEQIRQLQEKQRDLEIVLKLRRKTPIKHHKLIIKEWYREDYKTGKKTFYIRVLNDKGNKIRKVDFVRDPEAKPIKDFNTDKYANLKTIRKYFQNKEEYLSDIEYIPKSEKQLKKELPKFETKHDKKKQKIRKHVYQNENRLIFSTKQKRDIDYKFVYIRVTVKIFFNGYYVVSTGRSDSFLHKDYKNGIPNRMVRGCILQAVKRALAPYGSNLNFELVEWEFVYYQRKGEHFGELYI